jgi:hypothetical protein
MAPAFVHRPGRRCDERARDQPGRAQHHAPAADNRPAHVHKPPDLTGRFISGRLVHAAASIGAGVVLTLNGLLILQTFGVPLPEMFGG